MRASYETLSDKHKREHEKLTKTAASLAEANQVSLSKLCTHVRT